MATYKRRIVYFTDDQWAVITAHAKKDRVTISQEIRWHMDNVWPLSEPGSDMLVTGLNVPTTGISDAQRTLTQAERDAILRKINRGG